MAFLVDTTTIIYWVPDGANVQGNPSGPSLLISSGPVVGTLGSLPLTVVAGGDSPSSAQIIAAITAGGTANANALTAAQIAQIQGFSTGGN
jgi:hypothetical protein